MIAAMSMNGRILVADDDPDLRLLFRLVLQRNGYEVIEAGTGEQALERAIDSAPELILLDVMMPGLGGFETCRRLKNDRRTDNVPVVFVTARSDFASRTEGMQSGAEAYISKPISPQNLIQCVLNVLKRRDHRPD
jgi:CheY-like chemotaxis protein